MDFVFYKFRYIAIMKEAATKRGDAFYYTNGPIDTNEMRATVRKLIDEPNAQVALHFIIPITQEEYEQLSGKPFIV
jgi:hypothetical protein